MIIIINICIYIYTYVTYLSATGFNVKTAFDRTPESVEPCDNYQIIINRINNNILVIDDNNEYLYMCVFVCVSLTYLQQDSM